MVAAALSVCREKRKYDLGELFNVDYGYEHDKHKNGNAIIDSEGNPVLRKDENGDPIKIEIAINGFSEPGPYTPPIDSGYIFDPETVFEATLCLEEGLGNCFTFGDSGTGKSSFWRQVAARLNYNFFVLSCSRQTGRDTSLGYWMVKGKKMEWVPGRVHKAYMHPGTILCIDEFDKQNEDHQAIFYRPLSVDDRVLELPTGEELFAPDDFFIAMTANTRGMGDRTGLYNAGTTVLNFAGLNRCEFYLELNYPKRKAEERILMARYGKSGLTKEEAHDIVKIAGRIRESYRNTEVSQPVTPRDTQTWAKLYCLLLDFERASEGAFVRRFNPQEANTLRGIIQRVVEGKD